MQLPVLIDYTDFTLVKNATNVGKCSATQKMHYCLTGFTFRRIPRQKFIVPSGIPVHRPMGQTLPNGETTPVLDLHVL
jgi:fumarylacetoacetase